MFTRTFRLQGAAIKLYTEKLGHGFVIEENRQSQKLLQIPELNTGFDVPYWYRGEQVTQLLSDEYGVYTDSAGITERIGADADRLIPLCYKMDVPCMGNYNVRLKLFGSGEILVFAGSRRLVYRKIIETPQMISIGFILNVCEIIPRGKTSLYENKSVDIAVLGRNVRLSEITVRQISCPTIYIAGDSTVTDQSAEYPYSPGTSYAGWGQMLGMYLTEDIAVSNQAHSGLTVESFRTEGHYAIVQAHMKPGDYLLMQFGHNDQKLMHLKAKGGYRDGLAAYIEETFAKDAHPIIVTPLARNSWKADDGTYNDLLEEYADVCIEIGRQYDIPVIDLHGQSKACVIAHGLEGAKKFFFPKDFTHTNDYGAYKMAGFVVEDYLSKASHNRETSNPSDAYMRLAAYMKKDVDAWESDGPEELPVIPERYRDIPNPEPGAAMFNEVERPEETLTRVDALELVIQAARFFPTNVFNDVYDDIVGHEWYAGTVQCAYQNGIILPELIRDRKFEPDREVTLEEFLVFLMGAYRSRRKMPEENPCVLDAHCSMPSFVPFIRAAYALGIVDDGDKLQALVTRGRAAQICRKLDI